MIEILNYEAVNKNKIIGYVDILIPEMPMPRTIIRRVPHFQSGENRWFSLPTFTREKLDGTHEYLRYWQFEIEIYNSQLLGSLSEQVKEFCKNKNIKEIEPLKFDEQVSIPDELKF